MLQALKTSLHPAMQTRHKQIKFNLHNEQEAEVDAGLEFSDLSLAGNPKFLLHFQMFML